MRILLFGAKIHNFYKLPKILTLGFSAVKSGLLIKLLIELIVSLELKLIKTLPRET